MKNEFLITYLQIGRGVNELSFAFESFPIKPEEWEIFLLICEELNLLSCRDLEVLRSIEVNSGDIKEITKLLGCTLAEIYKAYSGAAETADAILILSIMHLLYNRQNIKSYPDQIPNWGKSMVQ